MTGRSRRGSDSALLSMEAPHEKPSRAVVFICTVYLRYGVMSVAYFLTGRMVENVRGRFDAVVPFGAD